MSKLAFVGHPGNLRNDPDIHDWSHWPENGWEAPTVRVPEFRRPHGVMGYITIVNYEFWKKTSAGVMLYKRPGYRVGSL